MVNESDIQKLLRLKRHEQPPPQYFEQFLRDFQRRQRGELLRQPAWKIALERIEAFFSVPGMGRYAYATATAVVLFFASITSYTILSSGGPGPAVAKQTPDRGPQIVYSANQIASAQHPRYVIDTRPASYERSFSF